MEDRKSYPSKDFGLHELSKADNDDNTILQDVPELITIKELVEDRTKFIGIVKKEELSYQYSVFHQENLPIKLEITDETSTEGICQSRLGDLDFKTAEHSVKTEEPEENREAVKIETGRKLLWDNSDSTEVIITPKRIDVKPEYEEEEKDIPEMIVVKPEYEEGEKDMQDSASLNNVIRTQYENTKDPDRCFNDTRQGSNLTRRRRRKRNKVKTEFKCEFCNLITVTKAGLKRHLLKHKNPGELEWFQCTNCVYRSVRKDDLRKHELIHKKSELEVFQCDSCSYQTVRKVNLKQHELTHKNREELKWFQCDYCDYKAIRKEHLKSHLIKHKNPEELEWFQCSDCEYQTAQKCYIKRHMLMHKNRGEPRWFYCDFCDYKATRKESLKKHLLKHKNPDELEWFPCSDCEYRTVQKCYLRRHMLIHKNRGENT